MQKTLLFLFLLSLAGCSNYPTDGQTKNDTDQEINFPIQPVKISPEGWGGDISLSVTSISRNDSGTVYKAVSTYENKNLGLQIFIRKTNGSQNGFGKGIVLKSLGKESDNLLQTLCMLYKQKADSSFKFKDTISADFVNLKEFANSTNKKGESYKIGGDYKLFFQSTNDDAELFINIDSTGHWIQLSEKDEEYRPSLIKFFKK